MSAKAWGNIAFSVFAGQELHTKIRTRSGQISMLHSCMLHVAYAYFTQVPSYYGMCNMSHKKKPYIPIYLLYDQLTQEYISIVIDHYFMTKNIRALISSRSLRRWLTVSKLEMKFPLASLEWNGLGRVSHHDSFIK